MMVYFGMMMMDRDFTVKERVERITRTYKGHRRERINKKVSNNYTGLLF